MFVKLAEHSQQRVVEGRSVPEVVGRVQCQERLVVGGSQRGEETRSRLTGEGPRGGLEVSPHHVTLQG